MTILAQLSDPHMRLPPEDEGAGDALAAAVRSLLALDPLPDAVIVTGDLADGARAAEYDRVRELLEPLPMPVHLLPGNHDDPAVVEAGYVVAVGELGLIGCDGTIPGRDDGALDLDWLAARRVIAGHVHRGAFGVVGGCGVVACPSTNLQAKLEIGADGFTIVREHPAFAVHALLDGELVSHLQPV